MIRTLTSALATGCILIGLGCDGQEAAVPAKGSAENPIRMYFVPSVEAAEVQASGQVIADAIAERTGWTFVTEVPANYSAVITELEADRADVVWLPTFAYVYAHERCGAEVGLTIVRKEERSYFGQILVRADSGIKHIRHLDGKRVAFTDELSAAGYVYPKAIFKRNRVKPSEEKFTGSHPEAIAALYNGEVDAACCFWSPPAADGTITDSRKTVLDRFPDVAEKLVILKKTDPIPNNTVSFHKGFPQKMRDEITAALLDYASTPEGKKGLENLYAITGFVHAVDSRYDSVREVLKELDIDVSTLVQ